MDWIKIRGARTHNLKNINIDIPRNKLVVITGLSGSGKSSLAFDTLFAEGQRRYVESLSAYARQFLTVMDKPDVDHIEGLSPSIAIQQKSTSHNPRSTVGTVTEIADYLRLLYARIGRPHCPVHRHPLQMSTVSQIVDHLLGLDPNERWLLLAPICRAKKGDHQQLFQGLALQGFLRARVNGQLVELDQPPKLSAKKAHDIDLVIDRFKVKPTLRLRLSESVETAARLGEGTVSVCTFEGEQAQIFSTHYACPACDFSAPKLEPRNFSFNSPQGACEHCSGLGHETNFDPEQIIPDPSLSPNQGCIISWQNTDHYYFKLLTCLAQHDGFSLDTPFEQLSEQQQQRILYGTGNENINFTWANEKSGRRDWVAPFEGVINNLQRRYQETHSSAVREELKKYQSSRECQHCQGSRLNTVSRHVRIGELSLPALSQLSIEEAYQRLTQLSLSAAEQAVAEKVLQETQSRLQFLLNVGLDYLSLARSADTLSGGEAQRIRLASQIGAGLSGVLYVLDEPSIGLHQRDNDKLLQTLQQLKALDNTVVVVEHDEDAIRQADHLIDIGPGAGAHGGEVLHSGDALSLLANERSLTADYLSGRKAIDVPSKRRQANKKHWLCIEQASGNNLKAISVKFPLGALSCVTGVSGSGKSTLINETLYKAASKALNGSRQTPAAHKAITGLEHFDKIIAIDQAPIGRTPRSNPATYTGLFGPLRELFAGTKEARSRGYSASRFSFNVKGGRCEACQGDGYSRVEMHFLPDVFVACEICQTKRYNRETLDIQYKGHSIDQVLSMSVSDALAFFEAIPSMKKRLQTLEDVGLGYITLGQSATTLSGGEAQRIKLAKELSKRDTGKTLYILDEPTTGLHFHDIQQLLNVLNRLADAGNTLIVIEHNLDVIKAADWLVDIGPEGGKRGGELVAAGTPEHLAKQSHSYTGQYLKALLDKSVD